MADHAAVSEFITKNEIADPNAPALLNGLVSFLKERGQFVETGDLQKQFIEKTMVKDKNKVPVEISTCLVCGNEQLEVKKEG